jgi:hypothetical protein
MNTKMCDACRATGIANGQICPLCRGRRYTQTCDCLDAEDDADHKCRVCGNTRVVPCDQHDLYADKCIACLGSGGRFCPVCRGAGVTTEAVEPIPRMMLFTDQGLDASTA